MLETRKQWLIRNAIIAVVLVLLWNTVPVKPFRALVVLLHEIFHALAALATGGGVHTVEVISYRVGLTSLYGGMPALVYSAGYIGTAFLGSVLLGSSYRFPVKRSLYLVIGILILANTLIFVRSPFGWSYGIVAGFLFIILFLKEFRLSAYIADFIGVLCLVDVFCDLVGFYLERSRNDAAILSSITNIPYYLILVLWTVVILLMIAAAIFITWKNLVPVKMRERLEWGEFHFVTKGFIERSRRMKGDDENMVKRRSHRTIVVYLSILAAIVLATVWVSRFVLFQPWTAREWVSATAAAGNIYAFGGKDREGQNYDEIYRIDLQDVRIHEVAELPTPRFGMGVAALNHSVYLLGGFDGRRCYDEILVFDTRTNKIKKLASLPAPRAFGSVATIGGRIFYLGGWNGSKPVDEILEIDPATGTSRIVGRLPSPREFTSAAGYGGRIYVVGGSDNHGTYLEDVLEIDPDNGAVLRRTDLPSSRTRSATVSVGDGIFVIGGWFGRRIDEMLFLDPNSPDLQIEVATKMEQGVSDIAAVNIEGMIYLIGGAHEPFQRQIRVQRWDPVSGEMESLKFRSFLFW